MAKRTVAHLELYQVGHCSGTQCKKPLAENLENALFVLTRTVVMGFCCRECFWSRQERLVEQRQANRATRRSNLLSTLGYDGQEPQPALETEGPPADYSSLRPKKKRRK